MSRSERKRFQISETKENVFDRDDWVCQVCGSRVTTETAQLAHRIPQKDFLIEKYGKDVIHHPENMLTTCSLQCNNAVQENSQKIQDEIYQEIAQEIEREVIDESIL